MSRKNQGSAGTFDVALPLTGAPGIEPRQDSRYDIVFTFSDAVTSVDNVSTSCGSVGSTSINGGEVTVTLTGLARGCNTEEITVTLNGVNGGSGTVDSAAVTFGLLIGDVNGDGRVSRIDRQLTGSQVGNKVTESNFRADVTADLKITHNDTV